MKLIKTRDYKEMSSEAARHIIAQVAQNKNSVLGLATGSTMLGLYEELIRRYRKKDIDFSEITTINLDEYLGLASGSEQSYRYYMNENFFNHINISLEKTFIPNGMSKDPSEECKQYDQMISDIGGIDLQVLGLGHNGHIGFNEPADFFTLETHCVFLNESTIKANSRFFKSENEVPIKAITVGMGCIMGAKKIMLCVNGRNKAKILKEVLYGPVTPKIPGSILKLHPNLIVIADEEALSTV